MSGDPSRRIPAGSDRSRGTFTCYDGWHVVGDAADPIYARLRGRLRDEHGTCVYAVGRAPDDSRCRTVWAYADRGVPWTCSFCGQSIDTEAAIPPRVLDPHRRHELNEKARRAYLEGAEEERRRREGRPLTAEKLERVLRQYPGDPFDGEHEPSR